MSDPVSRTPKTAHAGALAPLRHGRFRALWLATLASNTGTWIQGVAAAWAMASMASSAELVALVQTANALPVPLLSLLGGTLADQRGRRPVYLAGQAVMTAGSALLATAAALGWISAASLLALIFLVGCGTALRQPAAHASAGDLVPAAELPAAIALNSISFNLARAIGPALGGMMVAGLGIPATLAVGACLSLPAVLVLLFWRTAAPAAALPPEPLARAMAAGPRYILGAPPILAVLLRCLVFTLFAAAIWALLPVIARDLVQGGPTTYGAMLAGLGIGAVAGAFIVARLRRRFEAETVTAIGGLCFAVTCIVAAVSHTLLPVVAGLLLGGASWMGTLSSLNVLAQISAAAWVRGRVIAVFLIAWFGGLGLGSWIWGQAADLIGLRAALAIAGLCMAASPMLRLLAPLPGFAARDFTPLQADEPAADPGTGRILLVRRFHIDPAEAQAFGEAMQAVRRIRRRDGCAGWHLIQDLADPACWRECVAYASWSDYRRQRRRPTRADRPILQHADAFHRQAVPPAATLLREPD